jgi:hypothetical protein
MITNPLANLGYFLAQYIQASSRAEAYIVVAYLSGSH